MSAIHKIFPLGFPWLTQDPFLFCVYHQDNYPEGTETLGPDQKHLEGRPLGNDFQKKNGFRMYHGKTIPGFPYHPHRGFETITVVNKGYCDHSDSLGAAGRFGMGDVQWMTAGRGVQHSEMFPLLHQDKPNTLELFQIWLNLPQKDKFTEPHFKMLWREDIPIVTENGTELQLIAGTYHGNKAPSPAPNSWANLNENEVAIWTLKLKPNSTFTLPTTNATINRTLYFYEGEQLQINQEPIKVNHGIDLNANIKTEISTNAKSASLLLLQGKPIAEPIAQHGPFVMNTKKEIEQAFEEYRLTQFGGWPWPYADNVHENGRGRFANYPDGTIVEKEL
ncbi:pirin [Croceivirga radicis]|uniref:Pirin n=1 Tax=Croceivirga radicis TaxID=1929488 RepID=A0A1V6LS69_9FLAO|nr:pirin family protein [Croceivirga radicis]OQD43031.1 pirin [Croceivirga radicis]